MNIVVQLDNGKTLALKVESTNTVSDVKYLINEEEEMPVVGRQKLYMEGRLLEDDYLLFACGIRNGSVLSMEIEEKD